MNFNDQGNVLRWTAKWLEDRKEQVQLNGQIGLEVVYHKGRFWDQFFLQSLLMI